MISLLLSLCPADGLIIASTRTNKEKWKAVATGDAAYRAIVPTSKLLEDPELKRFVEFSEMTGWMGPDRHVMAYCIVSRMRNL